MKTMLLVIDIGNTNIAFGVFNKSRLMKKFNLPTAALCGDILKKKIGGYKIGDVLICSVVPLVTTRLIKVLKGISLGRPYIIGKDIKVPITNCYKKPSQVGQDRLVNAFAGVVLYGYPLIVIDYGTAVTFDVISKRKEYLGGIILPGLGISLDTLSQRAALLPKVNLRAPKGLIGRDTENSILSGIVYGTAALTDELVAGLKSKIGRNSIVVGTGGDVDLVSKYCRRIDKIDMNLTLKGMALLYNSIHS